MSLLPWREARHVIGEAVLRSPLTLTILTDQGPLKMTSEEARRVSSGEDQAKRDALWRQVITAARRERQQDSTWRLFVIWLAIPRITHTSYNASFRLRVERKDVEAEMLLALLEGVDTVDLAQTKVGEVLLRTAASRAWHFARTVAAHRIVKDVADLPDAPQPDSSAVDISGLTAAQIEEVRRRLLANRLGLVPPRHPRRGRRASLPLGRRAGVPQ